MATLPQMSGMKHRVFGWNAFDCLPVLTRYRVENIPAGARLTEALHSRSRKGFSAHERFCSGTMLVLSGCATEPEWPSASSAEIFHAAETKDLVILLCFRPAKGRIKIISRGP